MFLKDHSNQAIPILPRHSYFFNKIYV